MYGVEEPEVEDVQVGAVGRLADELDVPSISGAPPDDVRVVVEVLRWSVVMLSPDGLPPSCTRPIALDGGNHILYELLLVPLLLYLHTLCFPSSCRSASAVTLRLPLLSEREDAHLPAEHSLAVWVVAGASNNYKEHYPGDVRLVLNLARPHVFVVVHVVILPVLAHVKTFIVQVHEVEEVMELVSSAQRAWYR